MAGVALASVVGILIADHASPPPELLLALTITGLALARGRLGLPAIWMTAAGAFALIHLWQWQDNPALRWAETLAPPPRTVVLTGILTNEPKEIRRGQNHTSHWRARLRAETWTINGETLPLDGALVVQWTALEVPRYGDRWTIEGTLTRPRPARNPDQFDTEGWLARQGIFLELRSSDPSSSQMLARDKGSPIRAAALQARTWVLHTLGLGLEQDGVIRAIIAGITLGVRQEEAKPFIPAFRQTGTLHLFAVSGLHVGMFGFLLWLILRPLGLNRRQAIFVIVPLLFFYALITGAKPSSLRAATMISLALGGFLIDRPITPGNSLAAAALILLGFDTNQLFLPGFQLSFSVVTSIILLAPPLNRWLAFHLQPDPFLPPKLYRGWEKAGAHLGRSAAATLAVSSAAWAGSLPLTIGLFHLAPIIAIPANILAVPLAFAILSVSMLALTTGMISSSLAIICNQTNWALTSILLAGIQSAATLPGAWFHLPPGWMQPPARLTVFDLGTGGAQLLRTPASAWLFDAGTAYDFEQIITPTLRASGVGQLDNVVVTHGDTEHVEGILSLVQTTPPRRLLDSVLRDRSPTRRTLQATLEKKALPKSLALPGDTNKAGPDTSVTILTPDPGQQARQADDQTMVVLIVSHGIRTLLMSDAGVVMENNLLKTNPEKLPADILVFGRHGNDIFATSAFLAAVQPKAIILAAPDPFSEGIDEGSLRQRLRASGAKLFHQEKCGAVIITWKSGEAEIHGFIGQESISLPFYPQRN